eukprot:903427-Amphidinium_carterae.1
MPESMTWHKEHFPEKTKVFGLWTAAHLAKRKPNDRQKRSLQQNAQSWVTSVPRLMLAVA